MFLFVSRQKDMQILKMFNYSSVFNKCIEILERGFELGKILYSCGKLARIV